MAWAPRNILNIISGLGITTPSVCHDFGDIGCVATSADQTTIDLTGNGRNLFVGTTAGVSATDPAFEGTPGALTYVEGFRCDGGDSMRQTGSTTWEDTWHQDNAIFTLLVGLTHPASRASANVIAANRGSTGLNGFVFRLNITTGEILFAATNAATNALVATGTGFTPAAVNEYDMFGVALDENAGAAGGTFYIGNRTFDFNPAMTSPSATNPSGSFELGGPGATGGSGFAINGTKFHWMAAWNGTRLTTAQIAAIYNESGLRYGAAPEPRIFQSLSNGFVPDAPGYGSLEDGMI